MKGSINEAGLLRLRGLCLDLTLNGHSTKNVKFYPKLGMVKIGGVTHTDYMSALAALQSLTQGDAA